MYGLYTTIKHLRLERVIMWLEWFALAVALAVYVYFIVMSVVQVVLRQELSLSIREAETQVSELEAVYFARQNELSIDAATTYDLVAQAPSAYVKVAPEADRLTRRP